MLVRVMSVVASLGLLLAPRSSAMPSTGATPSKAVVGEVLPRLPLPDQDESDLLVVAIHGGEWCGTCRWLAEAEHVVTEASARTRIRRVDVILGDRDNAPADAMAIESWRRTFGVGEDRIVLSLDAVPELRPELDSATTLPLVLVVDARTQAIVARLTNPDPVRLDHRIRIALAELDGRPPPPAPAEDLVRGVFHANEWAPFFMHDGRFASLSATMEAYGWGGVALGAHGREPWTGSFGEVEQWALAEFLTTLTARPETP